MKTMQILSIALEAMLLDITLSKQTENLGVIAEKCASHDWVGKKIHTLKNLRN